MRGEAAVGDGSVTVTTLTLDDAVNWTRNLVRAHAGGPLLFCTSGAFSQQGPCPIFCFPPTALLWSRRQGYGFIFACQKGS